eukprot:TRINITY_DN1414_c1_g5_i1.p1 TRINITY_DN1414_c1_g5~~TRINITY_DN1414_c1_g5_i1.p1  ORF type:complete len:747 (-),score=198.93 TRINITY_DN1414_c1_g5_i1:264-2504(-)
MAKRFCFEEKVLSNEDFQANSFVKRCLTKSTISDLHSDLKTHQKNLKEQLVTLIDKDYEKFVELCSMFDGFSIDMKGLENPLSDLKVKFMTAKAMFGTNLNQILEEVTKRREIKAQRILLQSMLSFRDSCEKAKHIFESGELLKKSTEFDLETYIFALEHVSRLLLKLRALAPQIERCRALKGMKRDWKKLEKSVAEDLKVLLREQLRLSSQNCGKTIDRVCTCLDLLGHDNIVEDVLCNCIRGALEQSSTQSVLDGEVHGSFGNISVLITTGSNLRKLYRPLLGAERWAFCAGEAVFWLESNFPTLFAAEMISVFQRTCIGCLRFVLALAGDSLSEYENEMGENEIPLWFIEDKCDEVSMVFGDERVVAFVDHLRSVSPIYEQLRTRQMLDRLKNVINTFDTIPSMTELPSSEPASGGFHFLTLNSVWGLVGWSLRRDVFLPFRPDKLANLYSDIISQTEFACEEILKYPSKSQLKQQKQKQSQSEESSSKYLSLSSLLPLIHDLNVLSSKFKDLPALGLNALKTLGFKEKDLIHMMENDAHTLETCLSNNEDEWSEALHRCQTLVRDKACEIASAKICETLNNMAPAMKVISLSGAHSKGIPSKYVQQLGRRYLENIRSIKKFVTNGDDQMKWIKVIAFEVMNQFVKSAKTCIASVQRTETAKHRLRAVGSLNTSTGDDTPQQWRAARQAKLQLQLDLSEFISVVEELIPTISSHYSESVITFLRPDSPLSPPTSSATADVDGK